MITKTNDRVKFVNSATRQLRSLSSNRSTDPKPTKSTSSILTTLNPKNWGVTDYSNQKSFSTAYEKAKKNNEKEFMYNGKRYNTEYGGTPRQEIGKYGIDGKRVDLTQASKEVYVYPKLGQYLPGHIAAKLKGSEDIEIHYGPWAHGDKIIPLPDKKKGEKTFEVYNVNSERFYNKVLNSYGKRDYNLLTNNCAGNVCDAFGIKRSLGIETPQNTLSKIKKKYPTLETTGRTTQDYVNYLDFLNKSTKSNPGAVIKESEKIIGISNSPDLSNMQKDFITVLQKSLNEVAKKQNKPTEYLTVDGILGPKTLNALKKYKP